MIPANDDYSSGPLHKRVLLTGGAGFIGSHLAEALLKSGAQLTIVDNLDPFYSPEWKRGNLATIAEAGRFDFHQTDICDLPRLREAFQKSQPEIVIHLAARAGVRPSIANPVAYEQTNVGGTLNVLELCREFRVERMIFGSSSSVYGATSRAPFSEDEVELRPLSPYAATKLSGELHCATFAQVHGLPVIALRLFTVYGPRQRPDLAIHKFTALLESGQPVPIFGDGSTGRDYTWVGDVVAGILAAVRKNLGEELPRKNTRRNTKDTSKGSAKNRGEHLISRAGSASEASAPYRVYNLGNSNPVRLSELVEKLEAATGRKARRQFLPMQPGDLDLTWANISRAQRELRYHPAMPFTEGLERFVRWHRLQRKEMDQLALRATGS
jgi:UDP-glucuronate 4-epimerase